MSVRSVSASPPTGGRPSGPRGPRRPLFASAVCAIITLAVAASQALVPASLASAQIMPPAPAAQPPANHRPYHRPPLPAHRQSLAASARASEAARAKAQHAAVAAIRHRAAGQPLPAERTGSYLVSPAVQHFLHAGLGLPVGQSRLLTGLRTGRSRGKLRIAVTGSPRLRLSLPAGVKAPAFGHATIVADPAAGTLRVTSVAPHATFSAVIRHAASTTLAGGADESATATVQVPVLHRLVGLTGPVSVAGGAATVSLTGQLPADTVLQRGTATLAKDTTVTLTSAGGLRLAGPATLGRPGRQWRVIAAGALHSTSNWRLAVRGSAAAQAPLLPGLALAPGATGAITASHGTVRFDVHARTEGTWSPVPGVHLTSATAEFSDMMPNAYAVAAPGLKAAAPWLDVTGAASVVAGPSASVPATATVATNLATGAAIVTGRQAAAVTVREPQGRMTLAHTGFRGNLTAGPHGFTGHVAGTGQVSLPRAAGRPVTAGARLSIGRGGARLSVPAARPAGTPHPASSSSAASQPKPAASPRAAGQQRPAAPQRATAAGTGSTTYTLSSGVYDFIVNKLGIPLGSSPTVTGTLSGQTLTLQVGAPGQFPLSLPAGMTNPVFGPTSVTIDESADTVSLHASATAGVTAALDVTIANASTAALTDGTGLTAALTLGNLPFLGGSTAALQGTLGYTGGNLTASLTGSLSSPLAIAGGAVTLQPGTALTLATGSGLMVSGTAQIGAGSDSFGIDVSGTLTDLSNWSLSVSDANAPAWQPLSTLTITPAFTGAITDTSGSVGFDLAAASVSGNNVLTWSPGNGATLSVTSLHVSNKAPGNGVSCPASLTDGHVWIDLAGTFAYTPANISQIGAQACADLSGRSFQVTTSASGTLLPGNPTFGLTSASLTATGDFSGNAFSVTASASLQVNVPGGNSVGNIPAAVSFGNGGIVAAAGVSDLSAFSSQLSGSGTVYVSSGVVKDFKPSDYGLTGSAFPVSIPLQSGVTVAYTGQLPGAITSALANAGLSVPVKTVMGVASLGTNGFSASMDIGFGSGTGGLQVFSQNGSSFYLDDVTFSFALGAATSVTLSGSGDLHLPALWSGGAASDAQVTVSASFQLDSLSLNVGIDLSDWTNAFGINGMSVQDFAGTVGISPDAPAVSFSADKVVLPPSIGTAIGLVPGAQITLDVSLNLNQPLVNFIINNPYGGPALTPLAVAYSNQIASGTLTQQQLSVINSLLVYGARFYLAPDGGTTASGLTIAPGLAVGFEANVDNVPVDVEAGVGVTPPSLTANVSVGSYTLGPVQLSSARFQMNLAPNQLSFGFSGGVSYQGYSFSASVSLAAGTTANGATISLSVTGGLPWYLAVGGQLTGYISGDGSGASFGASGYGYFTAGGQSYGTISFSLTVPGGLNWADYYDSITSIAQFFQNAGVSPDTIIQVLKSAGFDEYDINNALGIVGDYGGSILNDLETFFGAFSNVYYDIWTYTSSGQLLVLDVAGGSQSPNAGVITYGWNNGYNQDWAFVQSPYSGWYEIVNRGSGQCLSVYNGSQTEGTGLVQYPCSGGFDQLWYLGNVALNTTYGITNANSGQVIDVQDAYPWWGGTVDQWPWNGGWNQQFWLTNSGN